MSSQTPAADAPWHAHVTNLFAIIDGQRWKELEHVFTEDCVYQRPGYEPLSGLARISRFYREERIIASGRHRISHVVGEAAAAACWGTFTGISRTGEPLNEGFADTYLFQGGKISQRITYFHRPGI